MRLLVLGVSINLNLYAVGTGMDGQQDQPIRRSTRLESRKQSQGRARRGRSSTGGDPNKK